MMKSLEDRAAESDGMVLAEGPYVLVAAKKTIDNIHRAADRQKILLVCEHRLIFSLVEGGVPVTRIIVGNMHYAEG